MKLTDDYLELAQEVLYFTDEASAVEDYPTWLRRGHNRYSEIDDLFAEYFASVGQNIHQTLWFREDSTIFETIETLYSDQSRNIGTEYQRNEYFLPKKHEGVKLYQARDSLEGTLKRVFYDRIDEIERRIEQLYLKIDKFNKAKRRYINTFNDLEALVNASAGGPVRIDADSDLIKNIEGCLEDINEFNGTNLRLEDFGSYEIIDGKKYFVFDQKKSNGADGLLNILESEINSQDISADLMIEFQILFNERNTLYKMVSNILAELGKAKKNVIDSIPV